jgi:transcriptional regulator with XRE-family HTH domain
LGWSRTKLASELQLLGLEISVYAVSNLERGERRLDPDDLCYFAAALGVDPNWLVGWSEFQKRLP